MTREDRLHALLIRSVKLLLSDAITQPRQDKERVKMLQQALAELETV